MDVETRDIALIVLGIGLAITGVGLVTVGTDSGEPAAQATTPEANETTTNETTTPESSNASVGPLLTEWSYSESDAAHVTKLLTETGDEWEIRVYRGGTLLTTIVPEPHELENGETSPTSSRLNEDANFSDDKGYALVGSRIDSGGGTEVKSDDVYGITLVLPNVGPNEPIRIEHVSADGSTTVLYNEAQH